MVLDRSYMYLDRLLTGKHKSFLTTLICFILYYAIFLFNVASSSSKQNQSFFCVFYSTVNIHWPRLVFPSTVLAFLKINHYAYSRGALGSNLSMVLFFFRGII